MVSQSSPSVSIDVLVTGSLLPTVPESGAWRYAVGNHFPESFDGQRLLNIAVATPIVTLEPDVD